MDNEPASPSGHDTMSQNPPRSKSAPGKNEFSITRVLLLVLVVVGVAGGGYGLWIFTKKPIVLVEFSGRVMYDGKPVSTGGIATMRLDDGLDGAVAALEEDGRFTLKTNGEPGAFVGRHKVVISANTPTMPPRALVPSVYGSMGTTPLTIEVSEDPSKNQVEFVLEGSLPGGGGGGPAAGGAGGGPGGGGGTPGNPPGGGRGARPAGEDEPASGTSPAESPAPPADAPSTDSSPAEPQPESTESAKESD